MYSYPVQRSGAGKTKLDQVQERRPTRVYVRMCVCCVYKRVFQS